MSEKTSTIPTEWEKVTLGDVVSSGLASNYNNQRIPLSNEERSKRKGIYPYYGAASAIDSINDFKFNGFYLLVAEDGTVFDGRAPMLQLVRGKFWVSNHAHVFQGEDETITRFLFYILKNVNIAPYVTGAVQPKLSKQNLYSISFVLPKNKKEQHSITNVLSSLDNKIKLLRQQNKSLETIAEAIYKEWFLKFNFPGTTGKMVASPLGEIPSGWRLGHLTEMLDFMEGPGIRNWQYTDSGRRFINIRLIQDGDINIKDSSFISEEEAETTYKHFHLQEKDMVVSTSGTLGRCAIVRKEHLPLILNTSVIRFRPIDKISYGFMYQYLNSNIFKNELESLASGSVQLNFGPVHLKQIEMLIPSKDVLQKFAEAVNPLYQKICFNLSQVQTLATLRDTLLPKLMKGEVRVKGFDC